MEIDRGDVLQFADLFANLFHDVGMAMPDRDGDDAGEARRQGRDDHERIG